MTVAATTAQPIKREHYSRRCPVAMVRAGIGRSVRALYIKRLECAVVQAMELRKTEDDRETLFEETDWRRRSGALEGHWLEEQHTKRQQELRDLQDQHEQDHRDLARWNAEVVAERVAHPAVRSVAAPPHRARGRQRRRTATRLRAGPASADPDPSPQPHSLGGGA